MNSPSHLGVSRQNDALWLMNNIGEIQAGEGRLCTLCINSGVANKEFN
jgi:hypothetical protein